MRGRRRPMKHTRRRLNKSSSGDFKKSCGPLPTAYAHGADDIFCAKSLTSDQRMHDHPSSGHTISEDTRRDSVTDLPDVRPRYVSTRPVALW